MGFRFTETQWLVVGALGFVNFFCAVCISLQAPFFPKEAEQKGSKASEYGLVFGVYELVGFVTCPIYGKYMNKIGAKKTLSLGVLITGCTSICFGLLDLVEGHVLFIGLSFLVRMVEALGAAAAITASYSLTAIVFSDCIATSFAILKGCFGLGFMLGPTIGGLLYEAGGFILPFVVVGCALLLVGAFECAYFPVLADNKGDKKRDTVQIFSVLKLPPVFLDLFSVTTTSISIGFFFSTLEPHLRQFNLSPVATGAMFMISAGTYALTSSLVGYLCDTRCYPKYLIILGGLFIMTGFSLVGPAPFLPMKASLYMIGLGLFIHGLGLACILISSFIDAIRSSVSYGFPNDMSLSGVVAGLTQSAFALGDTIGPSIAGFLFDAVGFRNAIIFILLVQGTLVVSMTTLVCCEERPPPITREPGAQARELSPGDCAEGSEDTSLINIDTKKKEYCTTTAR